MSASVSGLARQRGVTEVVHFTTDLGLLGILTVGCVLSRKRLSEENWLRHILTVNAERRWDYNWLDYVNLSVSNINRNFFGISVNWHCRELGRWWCILSFLPEILDHKDVWFSTTNNGYPATQRAQGVEGFEALFADQVAGRYGTMTDRMDRPSYLPTDPQAEILYPEKLSLNFLQHVYVLEDDHVYYYESLCDGRCHLQGKAVVCEKAFRG